MEREEYFLPSITLCIVLPYKHVDLSLTFFMQPNLTAVCGNTSDYKTCLEDLSWREEEVFKTILKDMLLPLNFSVLHKSTNSISKRQHRRNQQGFSHKREKVIGSFMKICE